MATPDFFGGYPGLSISGWTWVRKLRVELLAVLILGFVALTVGIRDTPLVDWDEATYAEVVHEAVANHSYLHFTWNGESYLKKPPVLFWMMAASFKTLGESEVSARLPSVVMGLLTLLMIYLAAASVRGRMAGFFAGLFPLGFYFFIVRGGRECATDAPLVFFSTFAIYALMRARINRRWLYAVGAACGLAILSKGIAGFVPLGVAAVSILFLPAFSTMGWRAIPPVIGAAAVVAGPWFAYTAAIHGAAFWVTFIKQEMLLRMVKHLEDQPRAGDYTIRTFVREVTLLWPLILPLAGLAAIALRRKGSGALRQLPPGIQIWLVWFALSLGAACAVQTKLGWYVLPALIPVALLGGVVLAGAFRATGAARRYSVALGLAAIVLIGARAPSQWREINLAFQDQRNRSRPSYELAKRARELSASRGGGELFFAGIQLPALVYYSRMKCHFVSPSTIGLEIAGIGRSPIAIGYHDLVMRDAAGELSVVDNFGHEWIRAGLSGERRENLAENAAEQPPAEE